MQELDVTALESKVDELIALCERLAEENRTLREERQSLIDERESLVERNERARSKIDATLGHLRGATEEAATSPPADERPHSA